jgi:hypothetical protein
VPYRPTLFVPAKEASDWNTLEGSPVSPTKFESINLEIVSLAAYRLYDFKKCQGIITQNTLFINTSLKTEHISL